MECYKNLKKKKKIVLAHIVFPQSGNYLGMLRKITYPYMVQI